MYNAMSGDSQEEYSEMMAETGNEIITMIMSHAKSAFKGMTGDTISYKNFEGKGKPIEFPEGATIVQVKCECGHGPFFMEFSFKY